MKTISVLFFALFLSIFSFVRVEADSSDQDNVFLFLEPGHAVPEMHTTDQTVIRSRYAGINWHAYDAFLDGQDLVMNLFPDTQYTIVLDHVDRNGGIISYAGHARGIEPSDCILTVGGDQIILDLFTPTGDFQVRYIDRDLYIISEIDRSAISEQSSTLTLLPPNYSNEQDNQAPNLTAPTVNDGPYIDVLVAYTPAAKTAAGGTTAINNLINQAIAVTNESYWNSLVIQRLHLVGTVEVNYIESASLGEALFCLALTNDNCIDSIHALRESTYADVVSLFASYPLTNTTPIRGISFPMVELNASAATGAFSVVRYNYASGDLVFAHEVGHNMGANHDWYDYDGQIPYPYAHGYVSHAGGWRTVMAYDAVCTAEGFSCPRRPYWSNPNISYNGIPTGVQPGTNLSCIRHTTNNPDCDANNALVLNNTRSIVADFRDRPTNEPAVIDHCGTIGNDIWYGNEAVHRVTCDVIVPFGYTLIIDEGAIVKFNNQARLIVNGKLQAIGSSEHQIYFTSYRDDDIGGDTNGGGS